eukprot:6185858-Pleurochrysis_carterae.AAC.1
MRSARPAAARHPSRALRACTATEATPFSLEKALESSGTEPRTKTTLRTDATRALQSGLDFRRFGRGTLKSQRRLEEREDMLSAKVGRGAGDGRGKDQVERERERAVRSSAFHRKANRRDPAMRNAGKQSMSLVQF